MGGDLAKAWRDWTKIEEIWQIWDEIWQILDECHEDQGKRGI